MAQNETAVPPKQKISEEQIYGKWLMDRPMEAPILAEHTKRLMKGLCMGPESERIGSAMSFLDAMVLRGVQLSCIGAGDVSMSGTGFALLIGRSPYDDRKKVYVGYYLGCAAVENKDSECGKMDFCTIWLTSRGIAASPVRLGPQAEVTFIDNPISAAESMGFYILSELGLDEEMGVKRVNVDSVVQEWEYKTSKERLPVEDLKLAEAKDTLTLGASILALQVLNRVYDVLGMKGMDLMLYSIYKRAADIRNLPLGRDRDAAIKDGWGYEAWCSYIFETEDGEALKDALYGVDGNVLEMFRSGLDSTVTNAYGLDRNNVYSFEDFTLFIPPLTEMITEFFGRITNRRTLAESGVSFEATMDFARTVYAAEAIYCRSARKGGDLTARELAAAPSAFPKLKKLIEGIYGGMPVMDDAGSYKEKNSKRETYYSSILECPRYLELTEELDMHKDKQRFMDALYGEPEQEETLAGLFERPADPCDAFIPGIEEILPKKPPETGFVRGASFKGMGLVSILQ